MNRTENAGIAVSPVVSGLLRLTLLIVLLSVCAGCSIGEIRRQSQIIGNSGLIQGKVANSGDQQGPAIVYRYTENKGVFSLLSMTHTNSLGEYRFNVLPGTHYLAVFIDTNRDGIHQTGEHWNYYGKPTGISVTAGQTVTVETIVVSGQPPALPSDTKAESHLNPFIANIGRVVALDAPMFNRENYNLGMWRPIDFASRVGGGLLFLQEYERDTIPVLFIHGVDGGPTDLKSLIDTLDRKRYQPWVLYYPSGTRLGMVSEYLVKAVADLQSRYAVGSFIVVGHSMGGLVARSFVKKYVEQYPDRSDNILLAMTINSPLGGMPSAAHGLSAPFMIQCWRDVAPGSDFLKEIHSWEWPGAIPYYLVFSHESGKDNDGVVSLESQIPLKLQLEAAHTYGFTGSHVGILYDDAFLRLFAGTLAAAR